MSAPVPALGDAQPQEAPLFPGHWLLGVGPNFRKDTIGTLFEATAACGDVARLRLPIAPHTAFVLRHPDHLRHVLVDNARNYGKQTLGYQKLRAILGAGSSTARATSGSGSGASPTRRSTTSESPTSAR